MNFHVIIVEDDAMVASIDRQYIETDNRFVVDGVFINGIEALRYLRQNEVDLIILDYYTPEMNGREFLDCLRAEKMYPGVIAVTSANDSDIVEELFSRGVIDYLVKPFAFNRFQQALERFAQRKKILNDSNKGLEQTDIDRIVHLNDQNAPVENGRGMNSATFELIRSFMAQFPGQAFTSEEIAAQVHLSRITIRRYVNHMVENGELKSEIDYHTGGRPSILYRFEPGTLK